MTLVGTIKVHDALQRKLGDHQHKTHTAVRD